MDIKLIRMMSEILTVLLIGLIVGVTLSMLVLFVKEKKFNPQNWKKDTEWKLHTQKLEVYGQLKTLLDVGKQRMKRQNLDKINNENTHLILIPEDYETFKNIFGKYRYLLSNKVVELYLELIKTDEYFSGASSKESEIEGNIIGNLTGKGFKVYLKSKQTTIIFCNLKEMESTTEKEYDNLIITYNKMIS